MTAAVNAQHVAQSESPPAALPVTDDVAAYLRATDVVDFHHPDVAALAASLADVAGDPVEVARRCFEWVRDSVPHTSDCGASVVTCTASQALAARTGFCFAKSHLLVALLRANGIPAGFCYQRLTKNGPGTDFTLHGLAAARLPGFGWYRCDPRGNKPGVDAQFQPPVERLAFATHWPGEVTYAGIYPDPSPVVLRVLRTQRDANGVRRHLPDAAEEAALELGTPS
jgi:transglutaminase-like putative cysteine protease